MSTTHSILFIYLYSEERLFLKRKRHFHQDSAKKAKKEAIGPPETEAKAKAVKAKKTVLKGIYSTQNETKAKDLRVTHIPADETLASLKGTSQRDQLHHHSALKLP